MVTKGQAVDACPFFQKKGLCQMEKAIKRYWPVFILPTLIAFAIGFVWPFIWGIYLSFCKFSTVSKVEFVGFSNYTKIFIDKKFRTK